MGILGATGDRDAIVAEARRQLGGTQPNLPNKRKTGRRQGKRSFLASAAGRNRTSLATAIDSGTNEPLGA